MKLRTWRGPVGDLPAPPRERCPELAPLLSHLLGRLGGMGAGLSDDGREFLRKILDSIRYAESRLEHYGVAPIEAHMWRNEPWMRGAVYICAACGKRVVWRDDAWCEERLAGHDWVRRAEGWTKMPNDVKPAFVCTLKPFASGTFIPTPAERQSSYKPAQAAMGRLRRAIWYGL